MQYMLKKTLLVFSMLLIFSGMVNAETYEEGKHYKRVNQARIIDSDKVEVLEFFWYGCPHCYSFEPKLSEWKKNKPGNVEFVARSRHLPAVVGAACARLLCFTDAGRRRDNTPQVLQ